MARGPRIDPYESVLSPQGVVDARRANAEDFGDDQGFRTLGQGLGMAARSVDAVQQDQARIWANTAIPQAELAARQKWSEHVDSLDPTSPDYPQQVSSLAATASEMWSQETSDLQSKAPNGMARRMIGVGMSRAGAGFASEAMNQQAKLNAGYTTNLVSQGVKAQSDLLAANPTDANYTRQLEQAHDSIAGLATVDPNVKLKLWTDTRHQFAQVQVTSFASQQPADFLQLVSEQGGVREHPNGVTTAGATDNTKVTTSPTLRNADGTATPKLMDALVWQESRGNPNAVSPAGAVGLTQLMPATAASVGVTDRTDPAQSLAGGTKYLNQQLAQFGDVKLALAAYNAGPGTVQKLTAKYGNSYAAIEAHLPAETQKYVPSILDHAGVSGTAGGTTAAALPQVQPLTDQEIAKADVPLAGWKELTWGEKVETVRHAESLLGKRLTDDRGATTSALTDFKAAITNGVDPASSANDPQFSLQHLTQLYGADEGQRKFNEVQGLDRYRQAMAGLRTMPPAQAEATIAQFAAGAGGSGAAVNAPLAQDLRSAYVQVQKQRQKDPLGAAQAYGLAGYKDLDWSSPEKLQVGLAGRVATARTMHDEYGTSVKLFNDADVASAQAALTKLAPQDRVNYLAAIVRGVQDKAYAQEGLREILPKGNTDLMTATQLALTTGGVVTRDGTHVSNRETADLIAEGDALLHPKGVVSKPNGDEANPAAPSLPVGRGVMPLTDHDFAAAFNKAVGGPAAFGGPNADYGARVAQETYDAVKAYYVADAWHRKADVADLNDADNKAALARAVDAVTGGVWKRGNGDALFAPQGTPMAEFQNQFAGRAMQALQAAGYDDKNAAWQFDHANFANFGDGRYVVMIGNRPLTSPSTGQTVTIDYSRPYTPPPVEKSTPDEVAQGMHDALAGFNSGRGR